MDESEGRVKMTELQYASLVISLSALGQVDISDMDHAQLVTLRELLDQAARNVRQTLALPDHIARLYEETTEP
jgi:hypothetical protein